MFLERERERERCQERGPESGNPKGFLLDGVSGSALMECTNKVEFRRGDSVLVFWEFH